MSAGLTQEQESLAQEPILIEYNGVTCSLEILEWNGTFSVRILGMKKFR